MKKKSVALFALLCILFFTACASAEPQEQEAGTSQPTQTEMLTEEKTWFNFFWDENYVSPTSTLAEEESWINVWDENYAPISDDPMAFCNLFPDPFFAWEVARLFKKEVTDAITYEELAAYEGGIGCGPGLLKSVEGIGLLTGVTSFSSGKNELETLPAEIGNLVNLTEIDLLKAYSFKRLPPEIGKLKNLTFLCLALTSLEALPKEIGNCEALVVLRVDATGLASIPPEIGKLKSLKTLDAHSTKITSLPDSLCELTSLEYLNLGYTKLAALPKNIGKLSNLRSLNLFGCKLKTLPQSMKQLKNLRHLNVYDNFELDEEYKKWFDKEVYS